MARPKGKFARITTQPYRPKNRKFNPNKDKRYAVVYPHPTKIGHLKTETIHPITKERYTRAKAIDRRDSLNALHEASKKTLQTEHWTVADAMDFWVERKASKLKSAVKETSRVKYLSEVVGAVRLSDLDEEHYEKLYLHIKSDETRSISTDRGIDAYFVTLRTALNYCKKKRKLTTIPSFDDFIKSKYEPRDRIASEEEL